MPVLNETKQVEENSLNQSTPDVLGRQVFIDKLIEVSEILSNGKQGACYAINGEWGVGKTFVLEAFEKQISEYQQNIEGADSNKYVVFHYNCWEYDYYEEPLIALVAVILDQIDKQIKLIPSDKMERIKAGLKIIGHSLWQKAQNVFEDKTGIPIDQVLDIINNVAEDTEDKIKSAHNFDVYYDFKKNLSAMSDVMKQLAENQTVILVVDELDRCLPEYAVKVLERLHHVFDGLNNIQIVLAVDKAQLENTIRQIYGSSVSVDRYLEKFIDFELKLVSGESSNIIKLHYPDYYDSFLINTNEEPEVEDVCNTLLKEIEVRKCRAIIQKSQLCHQILFSKQGKQNGKFLCIELFLTILRVYRLNIQNAKIEFAFPKVFSLRGGINGVSEIPTTLPGLIALNNIYSNKKMNGHI